MTFQFTLGQGCADIQIFQGSGLAEGQLNKVIATNNIRVA